MTGRAEGTLAEIRDAILRRRSFVVSSHARPDGDSIGSQLALAYALRSLGKTVRIVNRDPAPEPFRTLPGVAGIEIAAEVTGDYDAALVMECSDLERTGVAGLDRYFVINIDHHPGNAGYGALNWFDSGAAACGEMVFDLVGALDAPLSVEIATHVYLAILTDTGSFHFSNITARTFEICRQLAEAGVSPAGMARLVYDSSHVGRLKLLGVLLNTMEIDESGRLAVLHVSGATVAEAGGTWDDTDGLINTPLSAKRVQAVVFFKEVEPGQFRVSLRSKGDIDVGGVARQFGGGGHKNAAACSVEGRLEGLKPLFVARALDAIDRAPSDIA
jgi:phosphoesterase RecJ-like protein